MAKEYPGAGAARLRRRPHHRHAQHDHPFRFRALSVERANAQIDDGIAATAAALGDPDRLAPFFRFPGFGHTAAGRTNTPPRAA